ncbi:MAG: sulfatase [Verrucomicrobiales bacterium]|nr:sulfatase [Verrucomicrobiales bacterium]
MNESSLLSRRNFLARSTMGLGAAALSQLLGGLASGAVSAGGNTLGAHFAPRAKRVIFLFQSGGPSQLELLDYKPQLKAHFDKDLPDSIRMGQRITGMVTGQARLPVAPSKFGFKQCGKAGTWIGDLLPHTQKIADDICVINSLNTEAINHDPAITFIQTGSQQPGRPSLGSWVDYGLGSENSNIPSFIVLISTPSTGTGDQGLLSRLWGSGFLPSRHQGVKLRSGSEAVLYLNDPAGMNREARRQWLDTLGKLNHQQYQATHDPEIETRIAQYEMAYRMQRSMPNLMDLSGENEATFKLYGDSAKQPGSFAANCLLARRMAERGVRFIQLYHRGWDHHGSLPERIEVLSRDVDQASAALVQDLKQRGLLEDTLVVWGGEFGRTVYSQGHLSADNYGRDHYGKCFSIWMAGGGVKPGITFGKTDDFSFNIVENPVHIHDLQATILHTLGIDHTKLTYRFQGRQFRLTDVHGEVVKAVLA